MKRNNISIRAKIFGSFLAFAIVLLGVLWLFQIVYLNNFYKYSKRKETEAVIFEVQRILKDSEDITEELEKLAAGHNMAVYVTDTLGNPLYNAEYIFNSKMSSLPHYMFVQFYDQALNNGDEAIIEYQGSNIKNFDMPFSQEEWDIMMNEGVAPEGGPLGYTLNEDQNNNNRPAPRKFMQNMGNEFAESIIYVKIISIEDQEMVLMVNSVLTPVDATVSTLKLQLLIISGIMIVVAFVIAYMISRSISRPLIAMSKEARRLADGNYDVNFDDADFKEGTELSKSLNYAAKELGRADSFQKEIIANASHDLRTPLTMIQGYAEVMRDLPGENTPENVQIIIDETERLNNLVNDMLDLSKLKAGTMELNASQFNITSSIEKVLERYNRLREQEGYVIDFEYDRELTVVADEQKIYQVIYNLVNNAINYTGDDKKVLVRQIEKEDFIRIEVTDSGNGVAAEDLPYVWDRYYKVDKAHKRAVKGTGLGLSIVKNILELHKAHYGVLSTEGQGATFWFELAKQ